MPHTPIHGYRELTEDEIALINRIKYAGLEVQGLVDHLKSQPGLDARWVAIGVTHLQQGFMALARAVAQPEGF